MMAWELKKVEDQRRMLIELYEENSLTMGEICARFGVSRKTAYKWIKRYEEFGLEGLSDHSRAPHNPKTVYSDWHIDQAIEVKSKYGLWGPKKVLAKLQKMYPEERWPSERRLHDIFFEKGLVRKRKLRCRVPATHPLADVHAANQTWMGDFKGWFRTRDGSICEPFTVTDGDSRFVICCIHMSQKTTNNIWTVLDRAFRDYGLPCRFRTDNGPPFASRGVGRLTKLSVSLIKAGVIPEWIDPGHPEQNGRHERFHLTLKQEIADPPAATLAVQQRKMREFVDEYNFHRPHEALGMKTPAERYCRSGREWDGVLRSPEYDSSDGEVRKVTPAGTIWLSGSETYIGTALSGEYVQLIEGIEKGYEVYYGPIFLGVLEKGEGLRKPKLKSEVRGV